MSKPTPHTVYVTQNGYPWFTGQAERLTPAGQDLEDLGVVAVGKDGTTARGPVSFRLDQVAVFAAYTLDPDLTEVILAGGEVLYVVVPYPTFLDTMQKVYQWQPVVHNRN